MNYLLSFERNYHIVRSHSKVHIRRVARESAIIAHAAHWAWEGRAFAPASRINITSGRGSSPTVVAAVKAVAGSEDGHECPIICCSRCIWRRRHVYVQVLVPPYHRSFNIFNYYVLLKNYSVKTSLLHIAYCFCLDFARRPCQTGSCFSAEATFAPSCDARRRMAASRSSKT